MDVHLDLDEEEVDYLNDNGITDVIQENLTQVQQTNKLLNVFRFTVYIFSSGAATGMFKVTL